MVNGAKQPRQGKPNMPNDLFWARLPSPTSSYKPRLLSESLGKDWLYAV